MATVCYLTTAYVKKVMEDHYALKITMSVDTRNHVSMVLLAPTSSQTHIYVLVLVDTQEQIVDLRLMSVTLTPAKMMGLVL